MLSNGGPGISKMNGGNEDFRLMYCITRSENRGTLEEKKSAWITKWCCTGWDCMGKLKFIEITDQESPYTCTEVKKVGVRSNVTLGDFSRLWKWKGSTALKVFTALAGLSGKSADEFLLWYTLRRSLSYLTNCRRPGAWNSIPGQSFRLMSILRLNYGQKIRKLGGNQKKKNWKKNQKILERMLRDMLRDKTIHNIIN